TGHFAQIHRDGFSLSPLFGIHTRIRAWSIQERHDGPMEFVRQLHHPQRLPIAFGLGHPPVAVQFLAGIATLLLRDDHQGLALEMTHPRDDSGIVREEAVAVDFLKSREQALDVVQAMRPFGMPRKQNAFPGGICGRRRGVSPCSPAWAAWGACVSSSMHKVARISPAGGPQWLSPSPQNRETPRLL